MKYLVEWSSAPRTAAFATAYRCVCDNKEALAEALNSPYPPGCYVREQVFEYTGIPSSIPHWPRLPWLHQPGTHLQVYANQGWREARVLAALGDERLVEYEMPKGTTALRIYKLEVDRSTLTGTYLPFARADSHYTNVSYNRLPNKWLKAIVDAGQSWLGQPQQSSTWERQPDVILRQRELTKGKAPF